MFQRQFSVQSMITLGRPVIADDRTRSQNIEHGSKYIFCDRLRSRSQDRRPRSHAIIWKPAFTKTFKSRLVAIHRPGN